MEHGCEHAEGSPIGKCAVCERTVCTECYRDVFNAMICDLHRGLEDESDWELVGFYGETSSVMQRRHVLEENGITSLVVESDEDSIELYVPTTEKDDAYASLSAAAEDDHLCPECEIQYSSDMEVCPVCGVRAAGRNEEHHTHD